MTNKYTYKSYIILLLGVLFLNSCIVSKPDSSSITASDYNTRRKISNPHYHKKLSGWGISALVGGAAAGATAGYFTNIISYQKGETRVSVKPANAAIGAFVGFTTASLFNYVAGLNKTSKSDSPNDWIKKANKEYTYLPNSISNNGFTAILPKAENNYTVKNIQDARDFASVFPNSAKTDQVMNDAILNCYRDDMPELIMLFSKSKHVIDAKIAYIQKSTSYDALSYAVSKYPEANVDVENKFVGMVNCIRHAKDFANRYPNSNYKKDVVINAFITDNQSSSEISALRSLYINQFELTSSDLENQSGGIKRNYFVAQLLLANPKTLFDLDDFYQKYVWINYYGRSDDILDNYWKIGYANMDDGNMIIAALNLLATDPAYSSWGVNESDVNNLINSKLKTEAENKVVVLSSRTLASSNSEWDNWCKANQYTAGLVSEAGQIEYLIYGSVKNNSKFDLPIRIDAFGSLIYTESVQGTGSFSNFLVKAAEFLSNGQLTSREKNVGQSSQSYYIPVIPAGTTSLYAVVVNFGEGVKKFGINVFDFVKLKAETRIDNVGANVHFDRTTISDYQENMQHEWHYLASNGMPNATLNDFYRGKEFNQGEWDQKYKDLLEARRLAAIEARRNAAYANSENKTSTPCFKFKDSHSTSICDMDLNGFSIHCSKKDEDFFIVYFPGGRGDCIFKKDPGWYYYANPIGVQWSLITYDNVPYEEAAKKICKCEDE